MKTKQATLTDGRVINYLPEIMGDGCMKDVYWSADRSSVICLYKDSKASKDHNRLARLEAIVGKYNPTLDKTTGRYWSDLFCWPTAIIEKPKLGIVAPAYSNNFFFSKGPMKGREKDSKWFTSDKLRPQLDVGERGGWLGYFSICILLSRAIRRLHAAGLAHSDLSNKNVLIDPSSGKCKIIDIDSLVVPDLYPPDVIGTRDYIAPEVLATVGLPQNDQRRKNPDARTDRHALATLLYQYLLFRHPLLGPRTFAAVSAEEQERLELGSRALFIEHPKDHANRPKGLEIPYSTLGPELSRLFELAFIEGLHDPEKRPSALEWERGLDSSWDLLYPCSNLKCPSKWFILDPQADLKCPYCGTKVKNPVVVLKLRSERRPGQWVCDRQLVIYNELHLFKWHVFDNITPGEKADKSAQASFIFRDNQWLLYNRNLSSLTSSAGNNVSPGQAVELLNGVEIKLSREDRGRRAEVQVLRP